MIGITGATGHLGQELMRQSPNAIPIGRNLPDHGVDILIHAACPRWNDPQDVSAFHEYNLRLYDYVRDTRPHIMINVLTWWLYTRARNIRYSRLKELQRLMFPNATHVVPYSIYGDQPLPGRGFIPHLVQHLNGGPQLTGLSDEPRDFVHVHDTARAIRLATLAPRGTYLIATRRPISPRALAAEYGATAGPWDEYPSARPTYPHPIVPNWEPIIDLREHITRAVHPT